MAVVHGKDSVFKLEDSAGATLRDLTAYVTDVTLSYEQDEAQTTTKGQTAETYLQGHTRAKVEITGRYDSTVTSGPDVVMSSLVGDTGTCLFEFGPEGGGSTKVKYSGECFLTGYEIGSPLAGIVGFTGSLRVTGAVTRGTFP